MTSGPTSRSALSAPRPSHSFTRIVLIFSTQPAACLRSSSRTSSIRRASMTTISTATPRAMVSPALHTMTRLTSCRRVPTPIATTATSDGWSSQARGARTSVSTPKRASCCMKMTGSIIRKAITFGWVPCWWRVGMSFAKLVIPTMMATGSPIARRRSWVLISTAPWTVTSTAQPMQKNSRRDRITTTSIPMTTVSRTGMRSTISSIPQAMEIDSETRTKTA